MCRRTLDVRGSGWLRDNVRGEFIVVVDDLVDIAVRSEAVAALRRRVEGGHVSGSVRVSQRRRRAQNRRRRDGRLAGLQRNDAFGDLNTSLMCSDKVRPANTHHGILRAGLFEWSGRNWGLCARSLVGLLLLLSGGSVLGVLTILDLAGLDVLFKRVSAGFRMRWISHSLM